MLRDCCPDGHVPIAMQERDGRGSGAGKADTQQRRVAALR